MSPRLCALRWPASPEVSFLPAVPFFCPCQPGHSPCETACPPSISYVPSPAQPRGSCRFRGPRVCLAHGSPESPFPERTFSQFPERGSYTSTFAPAVPSAGNTLSTALWEKSRRLTTTQKLKPPLPARAPRTYRVPGPLPARRGGGLCSCLEARPGLGWLVAVIPRV